ncbi:coiled-coil domain-containing protein 6-like [Oscarella lobularis]|uniref:coiled-coil domain-containing protein 6-like n=1 Tax=Oscarella lobularis TaxID=121494 RepID=UPI003313CE88
MADEGSGVSIESTPTSDRKALAQDGYESDAMSTASGVVAEEQASCVRCQTLLQEVVVLRTEVEVLKLRCKNLREENKQLRQVSVSIQAQAEQEEEFISNTLMKKIHSLKKEKEALAVNYEQEEEFLTNDLTRKLNQLKQEKVQLEQTLEQEQEFQVNKLMKKIERLENETLAKQHALEQLRREKVDLENTLEQEQELLMNRLWKRMDKLESEKRTLEEKLGQLTTPPPSPLPNFGNGDAKSAALSARVKELQAEVGLLVKRLNETEAKNKEKMTALEIEERAAQEENLRLQRRLLLEIERREALSRQLSESESSLEMEDERHFNEFAAANRSRSASFSHELRSASSSSLGPPPPCSSSVGGGVALNRTSSLGKAEGTVPPKPAPSSLQMSSPAPYLVAPARRSASPAFLSSPAPFAPPSPFAGRHHAFQVTAASPTVPSPSSAFVKPKPGKMGHGPTHGGKVIRKPSQT